MIKKIPTEEELIQKMLNDPKTYAAIYARRSTVNENSSIDSQLSNCRKHANEKSLLIYKEYSEVISATKNSIEQREALFQLLMDAKRKCFKTLIVTRRDRLARKFEDYLEIKKLLEKCGVKILFQSDIECAKDTDPMSYFIDNVLMAVAEFEPNNIRQRVSAGMERKKEAGEYSCSRDPYGYKRSDSKVTINGRDCYKFTKKPEAIKIISNIFNTYVKDTTITTILELHKKLVSHNSIPSNFTTNDIERIIANPIYAGLMTKNTNLKYKNGEIIEKENDIELDLSLDFFKGCVNVNVNDTPFVTPEVWFKAVSKYNLIPKKIINKRNKEDDLFKDKVFCKICGNKIKLKNKYYRCQCKDVSISKQNLKNYVIDLIIASFNSSLELIKYINKLKKTVDSQIESFEGDLCRNIKEQKKSIDSYIETPTKKLEDKIVTLSSEEINLKNNIENLKKIRLALNYKNTELTQFHCKLNEYLKSDDILLKEFIKNMVEKVILDGSIPDVKILGTQYSSSSSLC